jgi:hypothetical protein
MPRTLPDGRTESPGVLRIYLTSMIILAAFYACSAVLQVGPGERGAPRAWRARLQEGAGAWGPDAPPLARAASSPRRL